MSGSYEDELLEGVNAEHRRLLTAAAAADLSEDEADVFLCSLEAANFAEMVWELGRPPKQVRKLLNSACYKILQTGLIEACELPEVPGL